MHDLDSIKTQIRKAFSAVEYPGDWSLVNSDEGTEPTLLAQAFKGKTDWRNLKASFIDQAPDGFGTALSFFSDEAFHFYLPAYLLADLDNQLEQVDLVFHLTHGLDNTSRNTKINPQRYGERTWFEQARHKFSIFNHLERAAIVGYLTYKRETGALTDLDKTQIEESLESYWARNAA